MTVLLFSDGITEATDASGAEFGVARLTEIFRTACEGGMSLRAVLDTVTKAVSAFELEQSDDQTLVVIRHTDAPGAIAMVTHILSGVQINIATMRVFRREAGGEAIMAIELDQRPKDNLIAALKILPAVTDVTLLDQI